MCFTGIIKINHKTIKCITVYEIDVIVEVIKSKLIIVIERTEGFSCTCFSATFFECTKIATWHCCDTDNFKIVFNYWYILVLTGWVIYIDVVYISV